MDYSIEQLDWLAQKLYAAGVFAKEVTSVDMAFAVLLAGQEMGFSPMASARAIQIVKGKVGLTADAQVAVCVRRRDVCQFFRLDESTDERATFTTHRAGAPAPVTLTYTMAQAKAAKLTNSGTWQSHPAAMLRARCSAALARSTYPDLVGGIYEPDEVREIAAETATPTTARVVQSLPAPAAEPPPAGAPSTDWLTTYRARVEAAQSIDTLVAVAMDLAPTVADKAVAWGILRGRAIDLGSTEDALRESIKGAQGVTKEPSAWAVMARVLVALDAAATGDEVSAVARANGSAIAKLPEGLRAAINGAGKARRLALATPPSVAALLERRLRAQTLIPDIEAVGDEIAEAFTTGKITEAEVRALTALQDELASALESEPAEVAA